MNWFNMIKGFYPLFWNKKMVADAVVCGKITETQYEEIVGELYTE